MRAARRTVPRGRLVLPLLLLLPCACGDGGLPAPEAGPVVTVAAAGAGNPTVALDPRTGARYVAWVGAEEGDAAPSADRTWNVYVARAEAGDAGFSAPLRVNDRAGDAAPHAQAPAQVAVGPDGGVYVLWQNATPVPGRRFPASDLRFARSTDGGRSWEPAVTVNDDAGGTPSSHTFHDLAVAGDGTVYASWIDSRRRDALRAAAGGDADEAELPGPEIRVARSTDAGRSFGPSVVVDSESCPCCRTSLAAGPDGAVYVAWRKVHAGDVRDVVVARSGPGELRFGAPARVHDDGWIFAGCPHAGPSLAVDAGGRVHVGWYTGREGRQGLWYAVSDDGARSFGAPAALVTDDWVPPSQVRLGAAGERVWIAWEDRRRERPRWLLGRAGASGGVEEVGDGQPGVLPSVAAAGSSAAVAWLDDGAVRARRLEAVD